jgi:hypothetical protein
MKILEVSFKMNKTSIIYFAIGWMDDQNRTVKRYQRKY